MAGWSSNSKYAFLGALRSTAQMISYEVAIGFTIITIFMLWVVKLDWNRKSTRNSMVCGSLISNVYNIFYIRFSGD